MVLRTILTRSGLISLNTARPDIICFNLNKVNNAGPMKNVINNAYSTARRPFNKITAANNSNFTKKVNTARPKAVLSAWFKGKQRNWCRKPALSFMRPFGCPVTILNTIDHLGKFDGKADEGFFVGYSTNSKAFRVFNSRTRIVEENPHVQFSENTSNLTGSTKASDDACKARVETVPGQDYILLPLWTHDPPFSSCTKDSPDAGFKPSGEKEKKDAEEPGNEGGNPTKEGKRVNQEKDANSTNTINTISPTVNDASIENNVVDENIVYGCAHDPNIPNLEEIGTFSDAEDDGAEADMTNLDTHIPVSPILTTRIHKDHHSVQQRTNHKDFQNCLFACFLSQAEPKKMDVKSAFLYDKIEEEVYVCQPLGFEDPDFPNRYPKDSPFDLVAYPDSDYAGASLDRKSTTGEAEYVAASSCRGQVLWIQNKLLDYGYNFMHTKINIDNKSTICIVKNPIFHSKIKHIEIRHHFIKDSNEKKLIQMIKIHTDKNIIDLLTKAFDVTVWNGIGVNAGKSKLMLPGITYYCWVTTAGRS
ncbi:putative ribonuclease H-like domain-containing protein [Tanacetum coccineum]